MCNFVHGQIFYENSTNSINDPSNLEAPIEVTMNRPDGSGGMSRNNLIIIVIFTS